MKTIVLALAAVSPSIALANGGGYVGGTASNGALGAFQPKNAQQIEMQTEDLKIDLHIEHGHVDVQYTLHNPGKAVTAEIGFPCKAVTELLADEDNPKKIKEGETTPPLRNFTVELDGGKVEWKTVREKAGQKDFPAPEVRGEMSPYRHVPYWYTFKLPFAAGQTRKLHVRYDTNYHVITGSVSEDSESSPETLTYLFSTAAVWKGPIGKGKVTIEAVDIPAEQVKLNLAKRFQQEGNTWKWEFKDFEPGLGDDLHIVAHPKSTSFGRALPGAASPKENEEPRYADFVHIGKQWTLHHRDYTATATSQLAPVKKGDEEITYAASNVGDNDPNSAWVEGVKGDGVGESITLTLRTPRKVSFIAVQNGYCKFDDESAYSKNGRPAEFSISINDGKPFTAAMPDERLTRHEHLIPVPDDVAEVKTIKLTIQKVYPGTKYQDTCISDIDLITPLEKDPKITPAR
jgi:hypothetical protein